MGHCQPRAPFHGLGWGFRGLGLLLSCPPYPPPPAWYGWGVARDEGTFLERLLGGSRGAAACVPVAVPAARGLHQLLASLQHGAHRLRSPPPTITPTVCCVCNRNPPWGVTGLPQSGTRGLGGQAWPVPWGHTRACVWAGVYSWLRPTAGTHGPRPPLHQASGKQPLLWWRSGHGWTALPDSIRQKDQI